MQGIWPSSGLRHLRTSERGWLVATDDWLRGFLARPELAPEDGSCRAERALHAALAGEPGKQIAASELRAVRDADVRENYAHFLAFRDALVEAGSLEAWYLALVRGGRIATPPLFIELVVHALVHHLLRDSADAFELRAGELLFRPQRVSLIDGKVLCADAEHAELMNETAGFGELGRMLVQNKAPLKTAQLPVLSADNAAAYWRDADRHAFAFDLGHEAVIEVGHGLLFTTRRSDSGLAALARVLERWVVHFLGVQVRIEPRRAIDDPAWRWHLGLDAQASSLLDDLYQGREVEDARMRRLLGLFRLDFKDPREMQADVAGKPVYLGLAMSEDGLLRFKPQNLLLNLPLAASV